MSVSVLASCDFCYLAHRLPVSLQHPQTVHTVRPLCRRPVGDNVPASSCSSSLSDRVFVWTNRHILCKLKTFLSTVKLSCTTLSPDIERKEAEVLHAHSNCPDPDVHSSGNNHRNKNHRNSHGSHTSEKYVYVRVTILLLQHILSYL